MSFLVAVGATLAAEPPGENGLSQVGIEPTEAGVRAYLESLLDPDLDRQIDALIGELANPEFEVRERASHRLASLPAVTTLALRHNAKLQAASNSPDAEQAWRAKAALVRTKKSPDSPLLVALRLVSDKKLAVGIPLLLKIRALATSPHVQAEADRALLAIAQKSDRPTLETLLKDSDEATRNTARWLLARMENPAARPLLEGAFEAVRLKPGTTSGGGPNLIQGWEFQPKSDLTVTHLGIYDHGSQGLKAAHAVAIWDVEETKTPLAIETIPQGDAAPLAGVFRFVPTARLALKAGRRYAVVAHYPDAADGSVSLLNPSGLEIEFASHLEIGGRRYTFPHKEMAFPSHLSPGVKEATLGPSFRYEVSSEAVEKR